MRKLISMATVTLTISQYIEKGTNITHIDIQQVATGGISGTTENRTLDWELREHKDGIFGNCKGKSRWVKMTDLEKGPDREWLTKGWLDENEGEHVQAYVINEEVGWTAEQVSSHTLVEVMREKSRSHEDEPWRNRYRLICDADQFC